MSRKHDGVLVMELSHMAARLRKDAPDVAAKLNEAADRIKELCNRISRTPSVPFQIYEGIGPARYPEDWMGA